MKRQLFFKIAGTAAIALCAHLAIAQSDSLTPQLLEEVSISAVRAGQNSPVPQVTLQRAQIQNLYQGQDGAFLLERLSPSLVSYSESGTSLSNYGQMRLRGIDQSRINITLNGVPLNDMIDQGVFFSNFVDFGNSMESVQVQRGVGTSTNGVASYAGSINFESINLATAPAGSEVQLTGGSFNTLRSSAAVSTGLLENKTAFYARMTHLQSDGYRYHSGTDAQSLFFSGGYFGEKQALKFTAFWGRSRNQLAWEPTPLALIKEDPRTNLISPNDRDDFGQYLTQLQHTWRLGERQSLVSTLYLGGAGGDFPFGYMADSVTFEQINYPLTNTHLGLMSNYHWQNASGDTRLQAGLHAYSFRRENRENMVPLSSEPYYRDRSQKDEIATFVKAQHRLNRRWEIFADLQLRSLQLQFSPDVAFLGSDPGALQRNYTFINPKLGLNFKLNQKMELYLSAGRSGREPTRFDFLGSTNINPSNLPILLNPDSVQAEYVNDVELGWRWRGEGHALEVNAFYMAFENEIAPIGAFIPEGFVQVHRNQAPSFRSGLELNGQWQISDSWELRAQGAFLFAQISRYSPADTNLVLKNVSPILSPQLNLQAQISYHITQKLRLGYRLRFLSSSYMELTNDEALTVPASAVQDLNLTWQFYGEHSLRLQFNNFTNELYYTYGLPGADGPAYFVQPPRHFYLTLALKF